MASPRRRADTARWHTASRVLSALAAQPGITRAALATELQLSSGLATETVARMRRARLLTEAPAPITGRGRPTTVLRPHPEGPVVLAVDLRQGSWTHAVVKVDGTLQDVRRQRHRSRRPEPVLAAVRRRVEQVRDAYGARLCAVSLAIGGTVRDDQLVQAATFGWGPVDLGTVTGDTELPLLAGNDATLAGVAEARTGAARTAGTALHLIVDVGIGGTLTVAGRPVAGAHGAGGEYGHLPFGDRRVPCPCGAHGCWELEVDGRALARRLREPPPSDPSGYGRQVITLAAADRRARNAVLAASRALGSGIAGLVNVHDPELVTLGGLGPVLRRLPGFDTAYTAGLMSFHRSEAPPVVDATYGDDGPLRGAAITGLDHATGESALAGWWARRTTAKRVRRDS